MKEINKSNQITIAPEADNNKLVAQLPSDALRAILAMCFGRPDSLSKVINRKFKIVPHDLINLNDKICRLLATHNVVDKSASITIKLSENQIICLESWSEFRDFDWAIPETIKYVELKWDFFIKTELYNVPQRHSLSVKISNDIRPLDVFRMIASNSTSEKEFEASIALCYINVDFIHHALADELIHTVSDWTESLPLIADENKFGNWCKKQKEKIAKIIRFSLPVIFFFCTSISLYIKGNIDFVKNNQALIIFCIIALLNFVTFFGKSLSAEVYSVLDSYEMYSPFYFSSGDKKYIAEIKKKNNKKIYSAIASIVTAFLVNLFCSILTAYILK